MLNETAPRLLAEACKQHKVFFIHISTDYVFDGNNRDLYTENELPNPLNVYGRSKFEGEVRVRTEDINAIILRTSWVFSPFSRNFLKTIARSIVLGKNLKVVDDQFGTPTSATTIAEACLRLLEINQLGEVFHFSGLDLMSWFNFAETIEKEIYPYRRSKITPCSSIEYKTRAPRPKRTGLDNSKIRFLLNNTQRSTFEEIKKCLNQINLKKYRS